MLDKSYLKNSAAILL